MRFFAGLAVSAGLAVAAGSASAQMLTPYDAGPAQAASDFEGPYGPPPYGPPMPPASLPRPYGYGPDAGRYGQDYNRYGQDYNRYGPDAGRYGQDYNPYGQDYNRYEPNYSHYGSNYSHYGSNYSHYGPDNSRYGPDNSRYGPDYGGYGPQYGGRSPYGFGPPLMPLPAVYAVLRENGFSPIGIPHRRGYVWMIVVVDRAGRDGRLLIDGRSGQVIRFTPTYRWGSTYHRMRYDGALPKGDSAQAALPPPSLVVGAPRRRAQVPQLANPAAPMPVTSGGPLASPQQSIAIAARPAHAPAAAIPQAAPSPEPGAKVAQSKPARPILPTREMPKVQGLE